MNEKDLETLAKAAKAQLLGVGEVFRKDAEPDVVLVEFLADVIAGANNCSGFDRDKFIKACGK